MSTSGNRQNIWLQEQNWAFFANKWTVEALEKYKQNMNMNWENFASFQQLILSQTRTETNLIWKHLREKIKYFSVFHKKKEVSAWIAWHAFKVLKKFFQIRVCVLLELTFKLIANKLPCIWFRKKRTLAYKRRKVGPVNGDKNFKSAIRKTFAFVVWRSTTKSKKWKVSIPPSSISLFAN